MIRDFNFSSTAALERAPNTDTRTPEVPKPMNAAQCEREQIHDPKPARDQQAEIPARQPQLPKDLPVRNRSRERISRRERRERALTRGAQRNIERFDEIDIDHVDRRLLATIGKFRAVESSGLFQHPALREAERSGEAALKRLRDQGLVEIHTVRRKGWKKKGRQLLREDPFRVVTLTQLGADLLRATGYDERRDGDLQAGLQKSREIFHDARMFEVCMREIGELKRNGCSDFRVFSDTQLKAELFKMEHQLKQSGTRDAKAEAAKMFSISVLENRYVLPDLRVEYRTPSGERGGHNIELYTAHYSNKQRAMKHDAGLKGWAIFDEGHIMEEIFAKWSR